MEEKTNTNRNTNTQRHTKVSLLSFFLQNFATIPRRLLHLMLEPLVLEGGQGLQGDGPIVDGPVESMPMLEAVEHGVAQVLLRGCITVPVVVSVPVPVVVPGPVPGHLVPVLHRVVPGVGYHTETGWSCVI
jgi:hypothetical protein